MGKSKYVNKHKVINLKNVWKKKSNYVNSKNVIEKGF